MLALKVILAAVAVLGLCFFGLCFNIIFKKNGKFPDGEIGRNKELRKRGIICMREEDEKIWGKSRQIRVSGRKKKNTPGSDCTGWDVNCAFKGLTKR